MKHLLKNKTGFNPANLINLVKTCAERSLSIKVLTICLLLTAIMAVSTPLMAATVSGRVLFDRSRTANTSGLSGIGNVSVVLQNTATNMMLAVLTDANGNYAFQNVSDGNYIIAEAYGMTSASPTPGNFLNAFPEFSIPNSKTPPIIFASNPPVGATDLDFVTPGTLFITVNNNADVTNQNFLNGPVKYIPLENTDNVDWTTNLITEADNGTFGSFPPGTPANTGVPSEPYPGVVPGFTYVLPNPSIFTPDDGEYSIQNIMNNNRNNALGAWWRISDHTTGNETGRMMVANGDTPGAVIFSQTVTVTANTDYFFSTWVLNLFRVMGYANPAIGVRILDSSDGTLFYEILGTPIPVNTAVPEWRQVGTSFNSGSNTTITLQFTSEGPQAWGNDFAFDDISLNRMIEILPQLCGGDGTPEDPYQICNAEQLDSVRYLLDKHFILKNDIDLTDFINNNDNTNGWLPIGDNYNSFTGTFNGAGHTITGLWINRSSDKFVGLFGYTDGGASIDSLGVEIASGKEVKGNDCVGGLVGGNVNSTISNCYAAGDVSGTDYVGGLVGVNNNSTIKNSYATGNVNVTSTFVGGLVGYNLSSAIISNCYAAGNVSGNDYVGGLVGNNDLGTITNSFYDSETSGQSDNDGRGTPKTTAEMKRKATFTAAGWNFDDVWGIGENNCYPFLQWQGIICPDLYIVTFAGDNISIAPQIIAHGNLATEPEPEPQREGYDFGGWFTDNGVFAHEWDFETDIITQDTTLYAKWDITVGIAEIRTTSIKVYPNPTIGILNIEFGKAVNDGTLTLFDMSGKAVLLQAINGVSAQINMSALPAGNYVLCISENGTESGRVQVIKQ